MSTADGAPGELELVRAFVNTVDLEDGAEELSDPPALARWLAARGLLPGGSRVGPADLRRALELREALRTLLQRNNGGPSVPRAADALDAASRAAGLAVRFGPEGARLEAAAGGAPGALGRLLAAAAAAMADGTWERLKACRSETCAWAFYDRSKNRSRAWCSMAVCGNRTKVKAYRRRRSR